MPWKLFFVGVLLGSLAFQTLITNAEPQPDTMAVPFLTQFDGSPYAATDCGPASVAMAINYATGEHLKPLEVRQAIMKLPGGAYAANTNSGTAVGDLSYYLNRPQATNDMHGLGAFIIMFEQLNK